jgi:hypothetical protein
MPCADGYTLAGAVNLRELHDRYGETPTRMTVPAAAPLPAETQTCCRARTIAAQRWSAPATS